MVMRVRTPPVPEGSVKAASNKNFVRARRRNVNEPSSQTGQAFEVLFQTALLRRRAAHALGIGSLTALHPRMHSVVRHATRVAQDGRLAVQQFAPPVVLQRSPATLDRVVLAVVGWIVSQPDREAMFLGKLDQPIHELTAMAMVLGPVI